MNIKYIEGIEYGYFPFEYLVDFLKFIRNNGDIIEIITYDDLPWGEDFDSDNNYPQEYKNWKHQLSKRIMDKEKIYVLIQHDVDSSPERTMAILHEEERLGLPSNVMIFNRRINRKHLQKTGKLIYTDYVLDYNYLRQLQDNARFVIAYHSNAFDQALFNKEKALRIFEDDVKALREHFNIRFFSPHGGAPSPEGFSNNILPIPESLKRSLHWVQNKQTVRFDGEYSDGGINSPKRDPSQRDLREFVRKWKRGKRYRVLIHPQYYHTQYRPSPRLAGTPWYEDVLKFYNSKKCGTAWDDIQLLALQESAGGKMSCLRATFKNITRRYHARR